MNKLLVIITYWNPSIKCSLPESFLPQWKCISLNSYPDLSGPPLINGTFWDLLANLTQTIKANQYTNKNNTKTIIPVCPVLIISTKVLLKFPLLYFNCGKWRL